jgi:hypothetical protein
MAMEVVALRDIRAGEEVTQSCKVRPRIYLSNIDAYE